MDVADSGVVGYMENPTPDFQNNNFLCITNNAGTRHNNYFAINRETLITACVYLAVRLCIAADWLNDRDQFLWPEDSWMEDRDFQTDCLIYTLFHGQNRISCKAGVNHWIPFTAAEVNARDAFQSDFMSDFLRRGAPGPSSVLNNSPAPKPLVLSAAARAVMDAGRALWRYYHAQHGALPDASFYDIRAHFQGFKPNGHMNAESLDPEYTRLVTALRDAQKILAAQIAPKLRQHGFLR